MGLINMADQLRILLIHVISLVPWPVQNGSHGLQLYLTLPRATTESPDQWPHHHGGTLRPDPSKNDVIIVCPSCLQLDLFPPYWQIIQVKRLQGGWFKSQLLC